MKLVGGLVCFIVCLVFGLAAGARERARTAECEAFLSAFSYIQNQITYFFAPTKRIYATLENDILARTGFLEALQKHENDEIYFDVWGAALASCKEKLHLTESQYRIVEGFGSCIGKSNEALQMKNLDYFASALASETEKQRSVMKKNIKVYRTLGFALGAAALILVL